MWEKIYNMKLGETKEKTTGTRIERILRVPGGWVYTFGDMQGTSNVFIPLNDEFLTHEGN